MLMVRRPQRPDPWQRCHNGKKANHGTSERPSPRCYAVRALCQRHTGLQRRLPDPPAGFIADVVEVRRVPANHRAETNHGVEPSGRGQRLRDQRNLERARHPHHFDILILHPVFHQTVEA